MLRHAVFFATLAVAATFGALVEIQIEGENGWASRLPTWRVENRWTRLVLGRRPLTGYHVYLQAFLIVILHAGYAVGATAPTSAVELRILSFLVLFSVIEDFLWFVLNPAYGVWRFRRDSVAWHESQWLWIMPVYYWTNVPAGIALYVLSH